MGSVGKKERQPNRQAPRSQRGDSHHQHVHKFCRSEVPPLASLGRDDKRRKPGEDDKGRKLSRDDKKRKPGEDDGGGAETPITSTRTSFAVQRSLRSLRSVGMTKKSPVGMTKEESSARMTKGRCPVGMTKEESSVRMTKRRCSVGMTKGRKLGPGGRKKASL